MSTAQYQRLPTSPSGSSSDIRLKARRSSSLETAFSTNASSTTLFDNDDRDSSERGTLRHLPAYDSDPRFYQPKPSPYARAALIIFIFVAFYVGFVMRADIFRAIIGQHEERIQAENEKWAEWAAAQDNESDLEAHSVQPPSLSNGGPSPTTRRSSSATRKENKEPADDKRKGQSSPAGAHGKDSEKEKEDKLPASDDGNTGKKSKGRNGKVHLAHAQISIRKFSGESAAREVQSRLRGAEKCWPGVFENLSTRKNTGTPCSHGGLPGQVYDSGDVILQGVPEKLKAPVKNTEAAHKLPDGKFFGTGKANRMTFMALKASSSIPLPLRTPNEKVNHDECKKLLEATHKVMAQDQKELVAKDLVDRPAKGEKKGDKAGKDEGTHEEEGKKAAKPKEVDNTGGASCEKKKVKKACFAEELNEFD
ncbi:hypothetical protein AN958_09561 [Leucoagaricus sp. SymC.cos]|nr:hypothetical protein AN958_09561 [Leucoagaricus sp. SymC.cos]